MEGTDISKINFGTAGIIQWIYAGGTTNLLPNYTTAEFNMSGAQVDTTSGSATWDTHNPSRQSWEATLELFWDNSSAANSGGTADLAKLIPNYQGVLSIGPEGTATGKSRYGGSATVSKNDQSMPFADPITVKMTFKGNGQPYWYAGSAY